MSLNAQSHRREARTTKASDLSPQTSSNQAAVQIKDALPFHERLGAKVVIADAESLDAD